MTSITTIRTNAYTAMYNLLSDATKGITNNTNIHSRYNDNNAAKEGYPQVIIKPIVTRRSEGFRRSGQFADVNYNIIVYHNSPENARTVADEIDNSITTYQATDLANNGFRPKDNEEITEDQDEVYAGARRTISIVSMNFPYIYREQVK